MLQLAELAVPENEPFKPIEASEHTVASEFASAIAGDSKVNVTTSDSAVHEPAGSSVVNVNVMVPLAISAEVGVYKAFKSVSIGE